MRPTRLRAITLLVVCALSCGAAPNAQEQKPAMDGYPLQGAPPVLTLMAAGAAPRTTFRYAVPVGDRARTDMTMEMSMSMSMAEMAMPSMTMPTMKMGLEVLVTQVAPNGDMTYDMSYTGMTVEAAGADPALVAAMQAGAGEITGIKGSATVSDRGVTRSVKMDFDKITTPELKQAMAGMASSVENMSIALPEEAIGVGAKWEVRQSLSTGGIYMFQKTEFEVVAIDNGTLTLKTKLDQTAPAQKMSNPALPPDAEVRVERMTGSGTALTTIRPNALVPTSEAQMSSAMAMATSMAGQTMNMKVDTTIKIKMAQGR